MSFSSARASSTPATARRACGKPAALPAIRCPCLARRHACTAPCSPRPCAAKSRRSSSWRSTPFCMISTRRTRRSACTNGSTTSRCRPTSSAPSASWCRAASACRTISACRSTIRTGARRACGAARCCSACRCSAPAARSQRGWRSRPPSARTTWSRNTST